MVLFSGNCIVMELKTSYLTFKTFLKQLFLLDETFDILFLWRNIIPDDNHPGYGLHSPLSSYMLYKSTMANVYINSIYIYIRMCNKNYIAFDNFAIKEKWQYKHCQFKFFIKNVSVTI